MRHVLRILFKSNLVSETTLKMTSGQKNTYHCKTKRYIHHLVQNLKSNKSFIKNNNILIVELSSGFFCTIKISYSQI